MAKTTAEHAIVHLWSIHAVAEPFDIFAKTKLEADEVALQLMQPGGLKPNSRLTQLGDEDDEDEHYSIFAKIYNMNPNVTRTKTILKSTDLKKLNQAWKEVCHESIHTERAGKFSKDQIDNHLFEIISGDKKLRMTCLEIMVDRFESRTSDASVIFDKVKDGYNSEGEPNRVKRVHFPRNTNLAPPASCTETSDGEISFNRPGTSTSNDLKKPGPIEFIVKSLRKPAGKKFVKNPVNRDVSSSKKENNPGTANNSSVNRAGSSSQSKGNQGFDKAVR